MLSDLLPVLLFHVVVIKLIVKYNDINKSNISI